MVPSIARALLYFLPLGQDDSHNIMINCFFCFWDVFGEGIVYVIYYTLSWQLP
jgi:hypothetical protein